MREAPKLFFNPNIFKKKKSTKQINVIVEEDVEGLICIDSNGKYTISCNNKIYELTNDSYDTKNKKIVYCKFLDKYNHRIKIIRDYNRIRLDSRFYVPFTAGLKCKGNIISRNYKNLFKIIKVYPIYVDYENVNRDNLLAFNEKLKRKDIVLSENEVKIFAK